MRVPNILKVSPTEDDALRALAQSFERVIAAVNGLSFGPPIHLTKSANFAAQWLVVQFGTALTSVNQTHTMNRVPVGILQIEVPPDSGTGELVVAGQVLFIAANSSYVTLQCTGANKKARLLLF